MAAVEPSYKEWNNCGTSITLLKTDLYPVSTTERNVLMPTVGVLCLLSLTGNIATLCVNFRRRRVRPFFRTCLFSLALSDLISTVLLTTVYVTQLNADYFQIWSLGRNLCKLVPYACSAAILANSITLVAIALDRYFALMNSVLVRHRDPNIIRCAAYMFGIWVVCIVSSVPMLYIYTFEWVHVYKEQKESAICQLEQAIEVLPMCISDDRGFGIYYIILTVLIFSISIVSFLWLNTMIARKLWKRRNNITARIGPTSPPPFTVVQSELPAGEGGATRTRKARHMRMFVIILMLMATFMFLRLPAWIFLIMRIYHSYSKPIDWMLYCCFAVLNMFSCVLNPLLYTFLTETIIYVSKLKNHLIRWFRFSVSCTYCFDLLNSAKLRCYRIVKIEKKNVDNVTPLENIKTLASQQSEPQSLGETRFERNVIVDLCGKSDTFKSFNNCNQSIYTIFPHSLITSSISSEPFGGLPDSNT